MSWSACQSLQWVAVQNKNSVHDFIVLVIIIIIITMKKGGIYQELI